MSMPLGQSSGTGTVSGLLIEGSGLWDSCPREACVWAELPGAALWALAVRARPLVLMAKLTKSWALCPSHSRCFCEETGQDPRG